MLSVLIDTNVWLDYHGVRENGGKEALALIDALYKRGCRICVSPAILKDVYYLIGVYAKNRIRAEKGTVSESFAAAANEMAWGCVKNMLSLAEVVGLDGRHCERAVQLRGKHGDFEDNLVIAAAEGGGVDYLVTNDRALRKHAPGESVGTVEMLDLLEKE